LWSTLSFVPEDLSGLQFENRQLREENRRLLMEREILKKATAFFAKEQS
jgi:transposase